MSPYPIQFQFHALPEETAPILLETAETFHLALVCTTFPPLHRFVISRDGMGAALKDPKTCEVALVDGEPEIARYREWSLINLEHNIAQDNTLRQLMFGLRGESPTIKDAWRVLSRRLKAITKSGVTILNQDSGASGVNRGFRYTEGARQLEASGVTMLPLAGGNIVLLGADRIPKPR